MTSIERRTSEAKEAGVGFVEIEPEGGAVIRVGESGAGAFSKFVTTAANVSEERRGAVGGEGLGVGEGEGAGGGERAPPRDIRGRR